MFHIRRAPFTRGLRTLEWKEPIMFARLRCIIRQHHQPRRQPIGGFRCSDCGAAFADLEEGWE